MLYLLIAILTATANGLILRLSKGYVKNKLSMLAGNYLTCLVISYIRLMPQSLFPKAGDMGATFTLSIINGILLLTGFAFMQYCTLNHGVVLTSVYSRLGVLVPTLTAVIFFHERPTVLQLLGFILAIIAIFIMNFEKGMGKNKIQLPLILLLILNGSGDAMAKFFSVFGNSSASENYLVYSFFIALILNIIMVIRNKERPGFADIATGLLLGIPNCYSLSFLLKAVAEVPAFIVYPTFSVGNIIFMSLAGVLLFKEKISKKQGAAIAIIMVSLVLLNI